MPGTSGKRIHDSLITIHHSSIPPPTLTPMATRSSMSRSDEGTGGHSLTLNSAACHSLLGVSPAKI
jgi:hypothetical protein